MKTIAERTPEEKKIKLVFLLYIAAVVCLGIVAIWLRDMA